MRTPLLRRARLRSAVLCSALLVLPLALAGCQSGKGDTKGMVSSSFPAPDKSLVYEAAVDALRQQGLTPDSSVSSEAQGLVITRHKLTMAPFSGQGHRDKATVRIQEDPARPSYFTAEVNVLRETNGNMIEPSNPVVADWGGPTRVTELENVIRARIEMRFAPQGASDAFRRERGMQTVPAQQGELGTGAAPGFKR
jgi:hypothetical protein